MVKRTLLILCTGALVLAAGCGLFRPRNAGGAGPAAGSSATALPPVALSSPAGAAGHAAVVAAPGAPRALPATNVAATSAGYRLRQGDALVINLTGIPKEEQIEVVINESGAINLPYINEVRAVGKTRAELEIEIRNRYLVQQIYKNLAVNVLVPGQFYFMQGEVKGPGRYVLVSGLTVTRAIAAAGGYTDYARQGKIQINRGNRVLWINGSEAEKRPEKDLPIEAGDVILVHRSWL